MDKEILQSIDSEMGVMLYFKGKDCAVCEVLEPKIKALFEQKFSKICCYYIDAANYPELCAKYNIFSAPTLLLFVDSKEFIREGRSMSLVELEQKVKRLYDMAF